MLVPEPIVPLNRDLPEQKIDINLPTRSLVVPVYNNALNIPRLLVAVCELANSFQGDLEAVFVIDGSPDDSLAVLTKGLRDSTLNAQVVIHSRNFGSFAAVRTGMQAARGKHIAVMAADLQEPISLIARFFEMLADDQTDVVVGSRTTRSDGALKDFLSKIYWILARRLVTSDLPKGGVDVFACNTLVRDALVKFTERNSSLIGQLYWLGFRREEVPYDREERTEGKSGWTLRKKIRYLLDSFFSFTDLPIRLVTIAGGFGFVLAALLSLFTIAARAFGWISVPGYTATILVVLVFSTLNLLCLGLVGNYVYRSFENSKQRPLSVIAAQIEFNPMPGAREPEGAPSGSS